ncbi:hypothetical protein Tco_0080607 [Tanacetum coccineum]
MSEADPIPPTSSVTALRIPMIKKGEYDLMSMKMRQTAIKARYGGNESIKKMQKNILQQQFETFTIDLKKSKISAYERIRLDELEFDDLYNNLKVYEHELKGVSNSNSQNIAFLSTEVKGSTLKQSTADPANIPKGYTQAPSSKHLNASTHDEKTCCKLMREAMEEIDIRRQFGVILLRECRIAKYQETKSNGRRKRIRHIEDSNSKALVATDNNEDIDWTKEFDAEPVTFAMMALTKLEEDDWSLEFDAEHVHFGQDGLVDF